MRVRNNNKNSHWSSGGGAGFLLVQADVSHPSCVTHVVASPWEETGMEGISSDNGAEGRGLF